MLMVHHHMNAFSFARLARLHQGYVLYRMVLVVLVKVCNKKKKKMKNDKPDPTIIRNCL